MASFVSGGSDKLVPLLGIMRHRCTQAAQGLRILTGQNPLRTIAKGASQRINNNRATAYCGPAANRLPLHRCAHCVHPVIPLRTLRRSSVVIEKA